MIYIDIQPKYVEFWSISPSPTTNPIINSSVALYDQCALQLFAKRIHYLNIWLTKDGHTHI